MRARNAGMGAVALGAAIFVLPSWASAQGWELVEPMPTARSYHAAAAVGDRWYVAGGALPAGTGEDFPPEVDVYDPTSGHWTVLGQLAQGREYILAIAEPSRGRVLFPGGFLPAGPFAYLPLATCDIAASDGVSTAPSLLAARHLHAVAFAAGKFVVSGGRGDGGGGDELRDDAEVWDGSSPAWMAAGRMPAGPRSGHSMTTLTNGRDILVAGGCRSDGSLTDVALFDPVCRAWKPTASLQTSRCSHRAVLLRDGRVLVVGGGHTSPIRAESSAEVFDPVTGRWAPAPSMQDGRFDHEMVLLPDGRVLVAGGSNDTVDGEYGALSSAEVYDPAADAWTSLPPMHDRRRAPTLAVLSDGVYIAGGSYSLSRTPGSAMVLASVERLAWSDLGITGPIDLDAGVADASPLDASRTCSSNDAGAGTDAAPDGGAPMDASQPDGVMDVVTTDAVPSDRETGGGKSGCSCSSSAAADDPLSNLGFASVLLGTMLRRRSSRAVTPRADRR
jgi:hypothetical protein